VRQRKLALSIFAQFQSYNSQQRWLRRTAAIFASVRVRGWCKNSKELMEIDLEKKENLININKIKMSFSVEESINELKQKDLVTIAEIKSFKEGNSSFQCLQSCLKEVHLVQLY
jgi:hypothetical protein